MAKRNVSHLRHKPLESLYALNQRFRGLFVFKGLTAFSFRAFHACAVSINKPQVHDGELLDFGPGSGRRTQATETSLRRGALRVGPA